MSVSCQRCNGAIFKSRDAYSDGVGLFCEPCWRRGPDSHRHCAGCGVIQCGASGWCDDCWGAARYDAKPSGTAFYANGVRQIAGRNTTEASQAPAHGPARAVPSKPAWGLLPMEAMSDVLAVLSMGATKYGPEDWRTRPDIVASSWEAAMRHLSQLAMGEELDTESGLPHAAHVAVRMLFILAKKAKP